MTIDPITETSRRPIIVSELLQNHASVFLVRGFQRNYIANNVAPNNKIV